MSKPKSSKIRVGRGAALKEVAGPAGFTSGKVFAAASSTCDKVTCSSN